MLQTLIKRQLSRAFGSEGRDINNLSYAWHTLLWLSLPPARVLHFRHFVTSDSMRKGVCVCVCLHIPMMNFFYTVTTIHKLFSV